jgi:transcriptional regulator with XRE-family HTH domain
MTALGEKVKKLRVGKRTTQQGLAEAAEVGHSLITSLESGRRRYVSSEDVRRLAKGLNVRPAELWRTIPGGEREARYILIIGFGAGEVSEAA